MDGPAGSGKTTLAAAIDEEIRVGQRLATVVFHLDDMYGGWETEFDELASRVVGQILEPLSRRQPGRWQRYDWAAGRFDGWETLAPPDVLVLEGCGSGARQASALVNVLVWVEAEQDLRVARGVARDGEQVLPKWRAWMAHEATHFAAHETRTRADVSLQT